MIKTKFSEVLTELILSHFPAMLYEPDKMDKLLEDILSMIGRLDYREKYEELTWKHCDCIEALRKIHDLRYADRDVLVKAIEESVEMIMQQPQNYRTIQKGGRTWKNVALVGNVYLNHG